MGAFRLTLVVLVLSAIVTTPGLAEERGNDIRAIVLPPRASVPDGPRFDSRLPRMALLHVGPRYGVGGNSPLGEEQKENFQLYDVAALFSLPWQWELSSRWRLQSRLLTSAGQLTAAGQSGLMGTLVPAMALATADGAVSLDLGLGAGFFSQSTFGVQDFGGPVQIVGTVGLGFDILRGFHAGYRFQHFSDAGMYGPTSLGVDMHIVDLSYRF